MVIAPLTTSPKPVGSTISYAASASGGNNLRYKWLFGDNTPETAYSTSPNTSHAFAQPGLYIIKLTVIDGSGAETSLNFSQAIHLPLTANRPVVSMNIVYEVRSAWQPHVGGQCRQRLGQRL